MSAGADANAFFLASHRHMGDVLVFVEQVEQLEHVDVRHTGDQVDTGTLETGQNILRSSDSSHSGLTPGRF
jgi:hypothetical protein